MTESASTQSPPPNGNLLADQSKLPLGWVYAIPVLAALLVFAQILGADWVYDDIGLIRDNPRMTEWSTIAFTFQNPFWEITQQSANHTGFYRPLGGTVFVVLSKLTGTSPLVFHLVSLLMHAGCTALIVRLALTIGCPRPAALIAGLYFAISGSHTEAVAWASSMPDVMAALFSVLAITSFLRLKIVWPALWLFLALLSKESAISTWLLLLAVTIFSLNRLQRMIPSLAASPTSHASGQSADQQSPAYLPRFAMLFAVAGIYWLLRWNAFDDPAAGFDRQLTHHYLKPLHQVMLSLGLMAEYLAYLFWPWPNFPFRPLRVDIEPKDFVLWGPALIGLLALLTSAVIWLSRNRKSALILIGFGMTFAGLAPVLNTKVIGRFPFEQRFLYLPSIGFSLLIGYWLFWLGRRLPKPAHLTVALLILGANAWSLIDATPRWKSEMSFFSWTRAESPNAMTPYLNMARLYMIEAESYPMGHPKRMEFTERAFQEYEASLKVDPDKYLVSSIERENGNIGMGQALFSMGDFKTAEAVYRETIKGYPLSQHAHLGIAQCILVRIERERIRKSHAEMLPLYQEAYVHAEKATIGIWQLEGAYEMLSICQQFLGQIPEALQSANRALEIRPDRSNLVLRKIELLWMMNRHDLMKQTAVEFLQAYPGDPIAHEFEGMIQMIDAGQYPVAPQR